MNDILRISKNYTEIIGILKEIMLNTSATTVWQNDGEKRIIQTCRLKSIDRKLDSFAIQPQDKTIPFDFSKKLTLYFKGQEQSILFKGDIQFASKSLVILSIPKEVRVIEKRSSERFYFSFDDERQVTVAKFEGGTKAPRVFEQNLLDISEGGIAFYISLQQLSALKSGDRIYINEICNIPLERPAMAKIRHISQAKFKINNVTKKGARVGAQFESNIDKELIAQLTSVE